MCIAAPRPQPLIDLFKDFVDFQSRPSLLRCSCRVLHTFSSTNSTGKKEKTQVGAEVGEGVNKNPEQIWPFFPGFFFTPSSTSSQNSF